MTAGAWAVLLGTWIVAVASPGPDFLAVLRRTLDRGLTAGLRVALGIACGIATWLCLALFGIVGLVSRHHIVFGVVRIAGALFLIWYGLSILRALWRARRAVRAPAGPRTVVDGPEGRASAAGSRPEDRASAAGSCPDDRASAAGSCSEGTAGEAAADSAATPGTAAGPADSAGDAAAGGGTASPAVGEGSVRLATRWSDWRLGYLTNTVGNPKAVVFFGALFASILPAGITPGESVLAGAVMTVIALAIFSVLALLSSRGPVIRAYQRLQPVIDGFLGCLFVVLGLVLIPWTGF